MLLVKRGELLPRVRFNSGEKTLPGAGREIRAAQYVRMSTDHQRYSLLNQRDAIAQYATDHGFKIVRTYADAGKSGLTMEGRDALKELLADVQGGLADFSVILVYDVSRWGRFPDADESAYNEHLCKRAGISVRYCAEQFENDGSLTSTIIKGLKRAMAAEYSRELSVKVFTGQCRIVELGFRLGGPAGYGLRRMLVDENGIPKCELKTGQRKSIQSDRVVLIPGPAHEVSTVIEIFKLFVNKRFRQTKIATILNDRGIKTHTGRTWDRDLISDILTSEKYVGNAVFNRTSGKIGARRTPNPPDQWIRRENAFPAVVPPKLFWAAQRLIAQRLSDSTDDQLLVRLSALLSKKGRLTRTIIDKDKSCPSAGTYRLRFGSVPNAYRLIGYTQTRHYLPRESLDFRRQVRESTIASIISGAEKIGCAIENDAYPHSIIVNGEIKISVVVLLCNQSRKRDARWLLNFNIDTQSDIFVAIRLAPGNLQALDYYILPRLDSGWAGAILQKENNGFYLDRYRFDNLDRLFQLMARRNVKRPG